MLKVKSGDLDKLGLLYERHKKRLFHFFYRIYNNVSLSEDLVQNVFMRMLKYKHTYTGEGSFTAWMFRLARNVNHDHFKKNRKDKYTAELSALEYTLKDTDDLNAKMDSNDDVLMIITAMNMLSPEKREILILSKFKEIKFSEIGEILGCSEGTARVKAHRALMDLRTVFLKMEKR